MSDEELAAAILADAGKFSGINQEIIEDFLSSGESDQAAISTLGNAYECNIPVTKTLVMEAIRRWPNSMGPLLAKWFATIPDKQAIAA